MTDPLLADDSDGPEQNSQPNVSYFANAHGNKRHGKGTFVPLTTTSDRETLSEPKHLSLFLLLSPSDLAEQLTLYMRDKFRHVTRDDLVGKESIGKWATIPNSGVGALTLYFNVLTKVVISEILSHSKLEKRKAALHYAILLGHELYLLNNFHAFYAAYCAITDSAIRRLAKTWANLPPKVQAKLDICHEAASLAGNYAFLVQRMEECRAKNLCLIPYLGIIQRDITMIVEKTKGDERELLLVSQYEAMLRSVNGQTRLDNVVPMAFFTHLFPQLWHVSDDDELSDVSNAYEPRSVRGESFRSAEKPATPESLSPKEGLLKAEGGRRTTSSKEMSRKGSKDNVKLHGASRKNSVPTQQVSSRFEMTSSGGSGPESPPKRRESQQMIQQRALMKVMKNKRNKHYQKIIFEYLSRDLRRIILDSGFDLKIVSENETSVVESNLLTSTTILQLRAPKYYLSMKQMNSPKAKKRQAQNSKELIMNPDGLPTLPPLPSTPLVNLMKSRYPYNVNLVFNDYLLTDELDMSKLNLDELFGLWHIAIVDSNLARLSKLIEKELFQVRLLDMKLEVNSSSSYSQTDTEVEEHEQPLHVKVKALVKKWNIPEVHLPFFMLTLAPPTVSVSDKSTSESYSEREEPTHERKDSKDSAASILLGKKKEMREKQQSESTSKPTTPLKAQQQAKLKSSDSSLAPPEAKVSYFEWPLNEELRKPFNFFCASHPDQEKRSMYIFTQKLEFYKTSTDLEDRKERGRRIMENHLVKNAPFFVKFPPEASTPLIDGIAEKIREYDLKAKWAMFLKAELANPDLCVFRPTLFEDLEKMCDTMMKETVAVEFFKSAAFEEFIKTNPSAVENLKRRTGDSISQQSENSGPDTPTSTPTTPTSVTVSTPPIPTVVVEQSTAKVTTPAKTSLTLSTPQSPTIVVPSPRKGSKSFEEQATPQNTPDKLSQAVSVAASTEWPMRKDLFVVFGNFCTNHPRIAISALFTCGEMLEKFKTIENMGERKALGSKIYDNYFKKDAPYKIKFADVTFDAALDALAEKIDKYELQAKWAMFLKAELANPDLCVYNQKVFETLEKAIDVRLKDTVAPEFYKSKLYEEYFASHIPVSPTTRSRAGTQFEPDAHERPKGLRSTISQSSDSLGRSPAAVDPNAWEVDLSHYAMDFLVFGTNKGYSDIQITICDSKNESQSYLLNTLIIKENCPGLYNLLELESLGQIRPQPVPISHEALSFVLSLLSHFGICQLFSFTLSIAAVVELMLKAQPLKIVNWSIVKNYLATRLKETTAQEASLLIEQYSNYFDESVLQELSIIHQESTQLATFLKNHLESLRRITIEVSRRYNEQIASLQARIEQLEKSYGSQTCARCAQGF